MSHASFVEFTFEAASSQVNAPASVSTLLLRKVSDVAPEVQFRVRCVQKNQWFGWRMTRLPSDPF
jgi:hypothetical protein